MARALPSRAPLGHVAAAACLVVLSAGGCAGGSFVIEPPLASVAPEIVTGPTFAARCETDVSLRASARTAAELLATKAPATTRLGSATLTLGAVTLEAKLEREAREAVLLELVTHVVPVGDGDARASQIHATANDGALDGLINVTTSTQTATVPYVFARQGRITTGLCVSALTANKGHPFELPLATLVCTVTPEDGVPRRLQAFATGSGVNMGYRGAVTGAKRWDLASQSATVLGMGAIRGFELRAGRVQIAAVSFWEYDPTDTSNHGETVSKAWASPQPNTADDDVLVASLALLRAYPLPSACDAGILATRHT